MGQLIELSVENYRSAVPPNAETTNYALISLQVPQGADFGDVWGELVLVLDRSGSMEQCGPDGKMHIDKVIDAAEAVARSLRARDRLAVVAFDDTAKVVCPLTPGESRDQILEALEEFRNQCAPGSGGGTEMRPALEAAMSEIRQNARNKHGARLVILTDGQAQDSEETLQYARTLERQSVAAMGFGDFDLGFMNQVCEASKGLCKEVGRHHPAHVEEFFLDELAVAQSTVASNLRLMVRPTRFVRLRKAYIVHPHPTFVGPVEMGPEREYRMDLPILERGEGIKVLFDLQHVPREPGRYSAAEICVVCDVPSRDLTGQEVVGNIEIEYTTDHARVRDVSRTVRDHYDRAFDEETRVRMEEAKARGHMTDYHACLDTLIKSSDRGVSERATRVRKGLADCSTVAAGTRRRPRPAAVEPPTAQEGAPVEAHRYSLCGQPAPDYEPPEPPPARRQIEGAEPAAAEVGPVVSPDVPGGVVVRVHFSVTSPPRVAPGTPFEVDIWAHLGTQRQEIISRAREALRDGSVLVKSKGPVPVARGTTLSVRLKMEGLIVEDPEETILWHGEIGSANFPVLVPPDAEEGPQRGLATVHAAGLQIARLYFHIFVTSDAASSGPIAAREERHRKAFVCYASADRNEVLACIRGMRKAAPDLEIFLDVLSLRSGQYWEEELWTTIPTNDVFYLFWSAKASQSEWVEKEWRCALRTRGLDFIDPFPLVSPDDVPPPPELASKHFNDWMLAFKRGRH